MKRDPLPQLTIQQLDYLVAVADADTIAVRPASAARRCRRPPPIRPRVLAIPAHRPCATLVATMYATAGPGANNITSEATLKTLEAPLHRCPEWRRENRPSGFFICREKFTFECLLRGFRSSCVPSVFDRRVQKTKAKVTRIV